LPCKDRRSRLFSVNQAPVRVGDEQRFSLERGGANARAISSSIIPGGFKATGLKGLIMLGEHKVAVITGASQGIGAQLVRGFREMGYGVVANSRSMSASEAGGDCSNLFNRIQSS
jgi:hypothetical protein